jgi:hypothetical protein
VLLLAVDLANGAGPVVNGEENTSEDLLPLVDGVTIEKAAVEQAKIAKIRSISAEKVFIVSLRVQLGLLWG